MCWQTTWIYAHALELIYLVLRYFCRQKGKAPLYNDSPFFLFSNSFHFARYLVEDPNDKYFPLHPSCDNNKCTTQMPLYSRPCIYNTVVKFINNLIVVLFRLCAMFKLGLNDRFGICEWALNLGLISIPPVMKGEGSGWNLSGLKKNVSWKQCWLPLLKGHHIHV